MKGLLYSCIGYDLHDPKWALLRADAPDAFGGKTLTTCMVHQNTGNVVWQGEVVYWGERWGSHWWRIDFTDLDTKGHYVLKVLCEGNECMRSAPIELGFNLLLRQSMEKVGIEQFEERSRRARNQMGWQDCGSDFKEANSHASALIGLCDFYYNAYDYMTPEQAQRFLKQVMVGCDYLALLQDRSEQVGHERGTLVHEVTKNGQILLADLALFVVSMVKASRILVEVDFARSGQYLERAERAMQALLKNPPIRTDGFNAWNHGAPEGYQPPHEIMTRDLLMMLWGAVELHTAGKTGYEEVMFDLARQVMARQVPKEEAEGGYWGHFYAFSDRAFTEKAFIHHHVCMDTGGIFPNFVTPLIEMSKYLFTSHPDRPLWDACVRNFANGYLLPACRQNPFYLMPMGYFAGEGILDFCGPWHGFNAAYGYTAGLAVLLEDMTGNPEFRKIAVGNLQWIAGMHCGMTAEAISDCSMWHQEIPQDVCLPMSQIQDVGTPCVQIWSRIPGSIGNGFSTNHQFQHAVEPRRANDIPRYYGDEDWIPHAGAWLYALGLLKVKKTFSPSYWEDRADT